MKKIVFFDIDGTLVTSQNHIPPSTKMAIENLKANDILPIIATGRAPSFLEEVRQELAIDSYISMNGQYIVLNGEVLFANPMSSQTVQALAEEAAAQGDGIILCGETDIYGNSIASVMRRGSLMKVLRGIGKFIPASVIQSAARRVVHRPVKPSAYEGHEIYQVIIQAEEKGDREYRRKFPDCHFTRSNQYGMDVITKGISKATAVEKVAEVLSVPIADTVAFGDGLNDIEMLQAVGHGVAMGNAWEEAKQIADSVTEPVTENGILKGLQRLELV